MKNIIELMRRQADFYAMNGSSLEDIEAAEKELKLHFAPDYREYTKAFGAASFAGHELTGVCKSKRLNVVNVTLEERSGRDVPADWYVIEQAHIDDIVIWQNEAGEIFQTGGGNGYSKLCDSLAEYIEL